MEDDAEFLQCFVHSRANKHAIAARMSLHRLLLDGTLVPGSRCRLTGCVTRSRGDPCPRVVEAGEPVSHDVRSTNSR